MVDLEKHTHKSRWLHPPKGIDMDEYLVLANKWIADAWQSVRGNTLDQSPTYTQYKRVAGRLKFYSLDVLLHAANWMKLDDKEISNAGANVIVHHYLKSVVTSVDHISAKFPDIQLNKQEAVADGLVEILNQVKRRGITYGVISNLRQALEAKWVPQPDFVEVPIGLAPELAKWETPESLVIVGAERDVGPQYSFTIISRWLTPREADIIALRFGFYGGGARSLEEVGRNFNLTKERIRQIEDIVLRKLRLPSRKKAFNGFAPEEEQPVTVVLDIALDQAKTLMAKQSYQEACDLLKESLEAIRTSLHREGYIAQLFARVDNPNYPPGVHKDLDNMREYVYQVRDTLARAQEKI